MTSTQRWIRVGEPEKVDVSGGAGRAVSRGRLPTSGRLNSYIFVVLFAPLYPSVHRPVVGESASNVSALFSDFARVFLSP